MSLSRIIYHSQRLDLLIEALVTQGPALNLCSFEQGKGGVVYTDMSFMRGLHPKGMPQSISNYTKGSDIKRSQDLTENRRQGLAEIPGSKSKD